MKTWLNRLGGGAAAARDVPVSAVALEQLADRYFRWHDTHFSRAWEYPWVAARLDLRPGVSLLDAGAGRSPLPFYCADRGATVCTVDSGNPGSSGAWGYFDYGAAHAGITSYNMDFCRLPWAQDGGFDYVVSVSVIEHLPAAARRQAWPEFRRVLKAGGRLVLTIDLQLDAYNLWNRSSGKEVEPVADHGSLPSLLQELNHCGFVLEVYELCPLASDKVRVAGLALIRSGL